jgi:hypothetical protein
LFAEVLDKEPNPAAIWLVYGTLMIAGLLLCRWRPWCIVIFVPASAFAAWVGMRELWDEDLGPDIFHESPWLFIQWQVASILGLVGPVSGFVVGLRRFKSGRAQSNRCGD